jgi:hypothetical protein
MLRKLRDGMMRKRRGRVDGVGVSRRDLGWSLLCWIIHYIESAYVYDYIKSGIARAR